jgi:uncharacterized protein YbjT (DUF2867 family)
MSLSAAAHRLIFVTGASGYIGGRLVPQLLSAGYRARCLVRSQRKLESRSWSNDPQVEIIEGAAEDEAELAKSMQGCSAAYYLIHSMISAGRDYRAQDRRLARTFARAAHRAGVERIIYLGGLGETGAGLSEHLSSRREVEKALASTPVPVTTLRAAMIIGSGSASFEILRYLVERLPVMVTPRWVHTESQPIAVRNVLHYLVKCLEVPETIGQQLDIGGPDVLSYREIMRIMADELSVPRRLVLPIPVLTPRLSSLWIHLVTPVSHRIARPLTEGLRNRVVCRDARAAQLMPQTLLGVREAVRAALGKHGDAAVETSWSDAGPLPGDPDWSGGKVFVDRRTRRIQAPAWAVHRAICQIGGGHGYYAATGLWKLRGWLDRFLGGPGLGRGRRDPRHLATGDALDFWRVIDVVPAQRLILRAEMVLPGHAELDFEIRASESQPGKSSLCQTARFKPRGLAGLLYWYAVQPLHHVVFAGMLRGVEAAAISELKRCPDPEPAAQGSNAS